MKKITKEKVICIIYCLVIFISMYPNKTNSKNLVNLNSIIPGIEKVYTKDRDKKTDKKYSFKCIELIQEFMHK